jgi:hypothetical protein
MRVPNPAGCRAQIPVPCTEDPVVGHPCRRGSDALARCGSGWPAPGVLLLTEPWHGAVDTVGLACALAAAPAGPGTSS